MCSFFIPSFFIFDLNVEGLIFRISAAAPGPHIGMRTIKHTNGNYNLIYKIFFNSKVANGKFKAIYKGFKCYLNIRVEDTGN